MALIEVKGISKSFKNKKILEGLSFSAEKGEIIGLVGKSGSGKSVFIKTLIGFFTPDLGKIVINSSSADSIGFSMQENSLYENLTVKQNLSYFAKLYNIPKKERASRIDILLERLDLKDYARIVIKNLSGGTKKRVDIACSLINDPEIIIFDEPLLGLDPVLVDTIVKLIEELHEEEKTIIISSHILEPLTNLCNKIFVLKNKRLVPIEKQKIKEAYS